MGPDEYEVGDVYVSNDSVVTYDTEEEQHCEAIVEENK